MSESTWVSYEGEHTGSPSCGHIQDEPTCNHPGWRHATALAEIIEAVMRGQAWDRDGDRVLIVQSEADSDGSIRYQYWNNEEAELLTNIVRAPGVVLVTGEFKAVSDEDVAAVVESIKSTIRNTP